MILKSIAVGPYGTNCYIVAADRNTEGLIIDPGADAGMILSIVNEYELDIKLIVITHGHVDHVGAVQEIKNITKAEVAVHGADIRLYERYVTKPDRLLKGGETIAAGDLSFQVLHTPGHSPGGICLYGHGIVFCGDTLFNCSIGRTDIMGGNLHDLMESIVNKLLVLPDETIAYPGHGPETTIGDERRCNPFLRRHA